MAWQHGFEVEIALAGESRDRATHREAVTNGNDADFWLMELVDKTH